MINNAGVTTTGPFVDVDPASIPRDIGINLVAPLHVIHTVAPWMRSPGAIVNTISLASITPLAGSSVYSATKFGLRGFNIALHMEMKPRGITVSGVLPGAIDTPMLLKETREGATALNFLGDPLPPEKVAKVILRAAKEGKVEYYIPYSERILSSFALLFPALIPAIYPWFEKMGVKRQKAYLASRAKDVAAGRHADPRARTGGGPVGTGRPQRSSLVQLFVVSPYGRPRRALSPCLRKSATGPAALELSRRDGVVTGRRALRSLWHSIT